MGSSSPTSGGLPCRVPCLLNATSDELISGLSQGHFTNVDLVNAYTGRTREVNKVLRAVMELNPDAKSIATQLDSERAQGKLRGPLHGLPVLIKGNMGTRDRMQTNSGSYALQDAVVAADSTVAAKLREHGLIILGKASLTEWSMFRSDNSSHAWNAIFGQTYGSYCPKQCPGGSSGGSAVAADLGLAWATLGTEVSRTVLYPFKGAPPDYLAACKTSGLRGKRIGIARNVLEESHQEVWHVLKSFESAVSLMAGAGATIVDKANFTGYSRWKKQKYNAVTRAYFVSNISQYLSKLERNPHGIHDIHDLRAFIRSHPREEFPRRNTYNWDTAIEAKMSNTCPHFDSLYQENLFLGGEGDIVGALERHGLDAVVLPSAVAYSMPALMGTPVVTVPLGAASDQVPVETEGAWDAVERGPGIPFGISFLGPKWSEETLIGMAYAFEQQTSVASRGMSRLG